MFEKFKRGKVYKRKETSKHPEMEVLCTYCAENVAIMRNLKGAPQYLEVVMMTNPGQMRIYGRERTVWENE